MGRDTRDAVAMGVSASIARRLAPWAHEPFGRRNPTAVCAAPRWKRRRRVPDAMPFASYGAPYPQWICTSPVLCLTATVACRARRPRRGCARSAAHRCNESGGVARIDGSACFDPSRDTAVVAGAPGKDACRARDDRSSLTPVRTRARSCGAMSSHKPRDSLGINAPRRARVIASPRLRGPEC